MDTAEVVALLARVRELFGTDVPPGPSGPAGVGGADGVTPGWSGAAQSGQQQAATALDGHRQQLTDTDTSLDGFTRQLAADAASGRRGAGQVMSSAQAAGAALAPWSATLPGRAALIASMGEHLRRAGQLMTSHAALLPQRQLQLATLAAAYRRTRRGGRRLPGGGGMVRGVGGLGRAPSAWSGSSGRAAEGGDRWAGTLPGMPAGRLTRRSPPRDVAAVIIHEALRRGYSPDQAVVILADALQESALSPTAIGGGGAWHGIFQQDASYPGRDDPNSNITEFFARLARHGGPESPDIGKAIFWLQQAPAAASAEAAFASGRQAYLAEFSHQIGRARTLFDDIAHGG